MVADSFVYHPSVDQYLRFVATTTGRDKILRTIQYFSKFYAWHLYQTNQSPSSIAPFEAIKKQFGLARKLLRIGKNIEHIKAASVTSDSKNLDPILRFCSIGRQLAYAGYLTLDSITYVDSAGIYKNQSIQKLNKDASKCWIIGIFFSTVSSLYNLYNLNQQENRIDKQNGEGVLATKRIEKERMAINLQILSDFFDITIPTSSIGLVKLDDGIVGLAGTMSSIIGVYNQWNKVA